MQESVPWPRMIWAFGGNGSYLAPSVVISVLLFGQDGNFPRHSCSSLNMLLCWLLFLFQFKNSALQKHLPEMSPSSLGLRSKSILTNKRLIL